MGYLVTKCTQNNSSLPDPISIGSTAYRKINVTLFFAGFITFMTLYDVQPLLPVFTKEFAVSPADGSLPLSISTAILAIGLLFSGITSDSFGRKALIILSLLCTSFLALITAWSGSFTSLLVIRLLQGAALAGVPSVAMAYLGEELDTSSIATAMGLYISGNAVGGMSGRVITALLTDIMTWRHAMGIIGAVSLICSIYIAKTLPTSRRFVRQRFSPRAFFPALFHHFHNRDMVLHFLLAFVFMGGFICMYNYITFRLLLAPFNLNQSLISFIFLVYFFGSLTSANIGRLSRRFGSIQTLRGTIVSMLVGLLLTLPENLFLIIIGIGIFTCGFFGSHSIASGRVSQKATIHRAQATSIYLFNYYLGSSVVGYLGGYSWQHYHWSGVALLIGIMILLACLLSEASNRINKKVADIGHI